MNELRNRYCHIKYNEKVAIKSQKSSDIILNYLKENDSINNSTAREITGLTAPAVRKIFKKLEAEGLIVGTGENKNISIFNQKNMLMSAIIRSKTA